MKHIAIIPARSGSKGLKDKNIRILNGRPMLAYSIAAAQKSGLFDEIMVSTDSIKYADIARRYGANVPFLRSEEMSSDTAGSWDAVREVLNLYYKDGRVFDTVCLLQPTSPLRTENDIIGAYRFFSSKDMDAVTSVCEADHPPQWMMQLTQTMSMREFRKQIADAPRQKLGTFYRLNGAIYIRKIVYTEQYAELLQEKEYAYIMDKSRSLDVDDIQDFKMAEYFMKE